VIGLAGSRHDPDNEPEALLRHVPDLAQRDVYVCGPEEWTERVRRTALDAGLPPRHLHIERFGW
jgi:ferredoxin-NADP reductase